MPDRVDSAESAVASVSSKRATLCEDHSGTFERNRSTAMSGGSMALEPARIQAIG